MHFLVLGFDGTDGQAAERRAAARQEHLEGSKCRYASGEWFDSGAILDGEGSMIGSFVVCEYPSRDVMKREWLDREPYVLGDVWQRVEIHPVALSPRALSRSSSRER